MRQGILPTEKQHKNRKPNGYWKDINNVIKEIEEIINKTGRFPTENEMPQYLASAIQKNYGMIYIRNYMDKLKTHPQHFSYIKTSFCVKPCILRSSYERATHAFLVYNEILHESNVKIDTTNFRCDFKLYIDDKEIFVEVWGIPLNKQNILKKWNYLDKRMFKTEKLYFGKKLIEIEGNILAYLMRSKKLNEQFSYFKEKCKNTFDYKEFCPCLYEQIYDESFASLGAKENTINAILEYSKDFDNCFPPVKFLEKTFLKTKIAKLWGSIPKCRKELKLKKYEKKYTFGKNIVNFHKKNGILLSLYSKGYKEIKNRNLSKPFFVRINTIGIGYFATKKEAFVAHKAAWRMLYYRNCCNVEKIINYAIKATKKSKYWIEKLKNNNNLYKIIEKEGIL